MLCFSFRIPEGSHGDRGPVVLVIILEKENLDRMQEGDPLDLQFRRHRGELLKQVDLIMAYEEDLNAIVRFQEKQDLAGLLKHLERGRKIIPGDVRPPVPLRRT